MKIFRRKKVAEEPTSGPGWAAYIEVPQDFDYDSWLTATNRHILQMTFRHKVLHFVSYVFDKVNTNLFVFDKKHFDQHDSDAEYDDTEFVQTLERGMEIIREIEPQVRSFAEQLIDADRAEIEYINRRIVYYRKDHPSNPGYARYIEDLDGSNRFEYGWRSKSGTREQIINSILYDVGYDCAEVEMETR